MSFILDALKKSDKKRQDAAGPRLDAVHELGSAAQPRRSIWILLLIVVLLINVGLLIWFFGPWQQGVEPDTYVASSTPPVSVAETVPRKTELGPVPRIEPQSEPVREQPEVGATASPEENSEYQQVYQLSELPLSVQRRIPVLHMSLHAFNKSSGAASLVRVNDQMLREGATLDGKYQLEEISLEGAIFRFEGYRFLLPRRPVVEN